MTSVGHSMGKTRTNYALLLRQAVVQGAMTEEQAKEDLRLFDEDVVPFAAALRERVCELDDQDSWVKERGGND